MKKIISVFMVFLIMSSTLLGGGVWIAPTASAQSPPHTIWGYVKSHNGTAVGAGLTVYLYNMDKSRLYSDTTDSNGIWLIDLDDYENGNSLEINVTDGLFYDEIVEAVAGSPGTQQAADLILNVAPTVSLVAPADGSSVPDDTPTLVWNSIDWDNDPVDTLTHTLYLDTVDTFDSGDLRVYSPGTSESYAIPTPLSLTTWYWKVNVDDSYVDDPVNSSVWEFTIDTAAVTNPYNKTTYNYTTGAGTDKWAYGFEVNSFGECSNVYPNTEFSASNYTQIESDDNNYLDSRDPGSGDEAALRFRVKVADTISDITLIAITYMGYGYTSDPIELYIWNYTSSEYEYLDESGGTSEFTLTGEVTSGFSNYFDGGENLTFLLFNTDTSEGFYTDYVSLDIYNWTNKGYSEIIWIDPPSGSSYIPGDVITLVTYVNDTLTGSPLPSCPVDWYYTYLTTPVYLGTTSTNLEGYATIDWDTTSLPTGVYYAKGNITDATPADNEAQAQISLSTSAFDITLRGRRYDDNGANWQNVRLSGSRTQIGSLARTYTISPNIDLPGVDDMNTNGRHCDFVFMTNTNTLNLLGGPDLFLAIGLWVDDTHIFAFGLAPEHRITLIPINVILDLNIWIASSTDTTETSLSQWTWNTGEMLYESVIILANNFAVYSTTYPASGSGNIVDFCTELLRMLKGFLDNLSVGLLSCLGCLESFASIVWGIIRGIIVDVVHTIYWMIKDLAEITGYLVDSSYYRSDTIAFMDKTAQSLPDILGPVNGSNGFNYILNNTLKVDSSEWQALADSLGNAISQLGPLFDFFSTYDIFEPFEDDALPESGPEPTIEQFWTQIFSLLANILDIFSISFESTLASAEFEETNQNAWGTIYWLFANVNYFKLFMDSSDYKDTVDWILNYAPTAIGPTDGSSHLTYMVKHISDVSDTGFSNQLWRFLASLMALQKEVPVAFPGDGAPSPNIVDHTTETINLFRNLIYLSNKLMYEIFDSGELDESELDTLFRQMWGIIYWLLKDVTSLVSGTDRAYVYNFTNTTADVLPDLLGPINGTKALTYFLNNTLKVDQETVTKPFVNDLLDSMVYSLHIIQWVLLNLGDSLPPTGPEPDMEDFTQLSLVPSVLDFVEILMDSILNNYPTELNETGRRIWGVSYWGSKNINQIAENINVTKVETLINDTVYYLPDILGNDTIGATYLLKEGRGNIDPRFSEQLFEVLPLFVQFLATPMRELPNAFPESGPYNQTALSTEKAKRLTSELALAEMFLTEVLSLSQPEKDIITERIWNIIFWAVPAIRDISNVTESGYVANLSNATTDYGSDIIGPLSGSSGITYLIRGYTSVPFSTGVELLRAIFDVLALTIRFVAELMRGLPNVLLWR